jgi:hypothetical protein
MANKRYDAVTRRKLKKRIRALHKEGKQYAEMAAVLSAEGFTAPDGSPLRDTTVASQGKQAGIKKVHRRSGRSVEPKFPTVTEAKSDDESLMDLILDSNISDAKKVSLVKRLRGGDL